MPHDNRAKLFAAFAAVYVIWGSTYLAIRYAIETLPPFGMAGVRFLVAGALMVLWARTQGAPWPTRREWWNGFVIGSLLLLGGNGGVTWAELRVASGVAALVVGAVPLWIVLLDWIRPRGKRPTRGVVAGLVLGFAGLALLIAPSAADAATVHPWGALALLAATLSWSLGSVYSRSAVTARSPLMATGANMLGGGGGLLAVSVALGEPARFALAAVSLRSFAAFVYLVLFGSLVAFTAYVWLLRNTTAAKAATYAYVNPVVAVLLGSVIGGEPLSGRMLLAAGIIIAGVVMITSLPYLRPAALHLWRALRSSVRERPLAERASTRD